MKPFKTEISLSELRKALDYSPDTGIFRWKIKSGRSKIGKIAGTPTQPGYISICVSGHKYQAHRLAWLYMTRKWPRKEIDHINLIKTDNRFANLRVASKSENKANCPKPKTGKNPVKGVHKQRNKWVAQIQVNRKPTHLGSFKTIQEAAEAYLAAAKKFFGEFARAE